LTSLIIYQFEQRSLTLKRVGKKKFSILIVNNKNDEKVKYSTKNIQGIKIINSNNINILDLLRYKNLFLTKRALKELEDQYGDGKQKAKEVKKKSVATKVKANKKVKKNDNK